MSFTPEHQKYINTLSNPGLNVAQQLIRTAGKGRTNGLSYSPPTAAVVKKTRGLIQGLLEFDANPTDETFGNVQTSLQSLNMQAVQVEGAPEWIYITPDAPPGSKQWEAYSKATQFNLSWHVGSDSKVVASDEHNGGDGCHRVVGALVEQGSNIKLVMSNSRHRGTSKRNKSGRFEGDWAHSKATIAYPIMCDLASEDYSIINIHGMASKQYGLLVNNYSSNFVKDLASLPTFIGIALAQYFNDSGNKKFTFAGVLPGSIVVNGARKPLSPPHNANAAPNSIFYRTKGAHNTNTIGNAENAIGSRRSGRKPGDIGRSCHIEFGIARDGRGDLKKVIAAIDQAAFWMNNYQPEFNPWQIAKNDPNFDMLNYGDLYKDVPGYVSKLEVAADDDNETHFAKDSASEEVFDTDANPNEYEFSLDDDKENQPPPLLLSGGPKSKPKPTKASNEETQEVTKKPAPAPVN